MDNETIKFLGFLGVFVIVSCGGGAWFLGWKKEKEGQVLLERRRARGEARLNEMIWRGGEIAKNNVAAMNSASDNRDGSAWEPIHRAARETIYMANRAMSERSKE